jgi:uncharacterized membrane protein
MTRRQLKDATLRARALSAQGVAKAEIFNQIAPEVQKTLIAARIVASIPSPEGMRRYRLMNIVLGSLMMVLAILIGLAKAAQVSARLGPELAPGTVAVVAILLGLLFFGIFASVSVSIFKYKYGGYVGAVILLLLMILQSVSATMHALADPSSGALPLLELLFGVLLPILLIWLAVKVRNNVFVKARLFGAPRKNPDGSFEFSPAFELRKAKG